MTTKPKKEPLVLHKELKRLLNLHGLTAAEVARRTGVARSVLCDWLAGAQPRNLAQVKAVADCLEVTIEALCFGSSAPKVSENCLWIDGVFEGRLRVVRKN